MRRLLARSVWALVALAASGPAVAQTPPAPPPRPVLVAPEVTDEIEQEIGDSPQAAYRLAVTLLDGGRTEEATAMLEDLYRADPGSLAVWLKLKEAYGAGRQFDALVRAVDQRIEREGRSAALLAERGAALHRADRPDEAEQSWAQALAVAPDDAQTYRTVSNEIGALRLYARAAQVLEQGRARLGDAEPFVIERAYLWGLALETARATDLYLEFLSTHPDARAVVQARLTRLLAGLGAPEIVAAAVEAAAVRAPLDRGLRELQSWLALERGDYDAALDGIRALDRLEREQGETLLSFAVQARGADAPQAAGRALDEILERHPDGPAAPTARLLRAQLDEQAARDARERPDLGPTPRADAARAGYVAYLDAYAGAGSAPAAALALADLLRDVYRDFDGSEARLRQAAAGRDAGVAAQARLALGDLAIRRGDLDAARQRFADVDESIRIGPLAEQARYELALVDFYEGLMFSALARAEALDENTAADASNDAIALRVTLKEVLGPEAEAETDPASDPLHVYARAALRHRQGLSGPALATLDSLDAALPATHALADESLYLRASALLESGRVPDAVAVLDRLGEQHPDSFFLDRALRLQAQAYERDLADRTRAAERWNRLLELFPGSPLAPEARAELRRLRSLS